MLRIAGLLLLLCVSVQAQWTPVNGPFGMITEALFQKDSVLYAGTNWGIFRSRDAGLNWDRTGERFSSQGFAAAGAYVFCQSRYHVLRTGNRGDTWETIHAGLPDSSLMDLAAVGGTVLAATGHGLYRSDDFGASWKPSWSGIPDSVASRLRVDGSRVLAATRSALYRSDDAGRTWALTGQGLPPISDGAFYQSFARTRDNLFAWTGKGVFRSADAGATWTQIPAAPADSSIMAVFDDGRNLFVGTLHGLFRSSDEGATFTMVNPGFTIGFLPIEAAQRGPEMFLATNRGVHRSLDQGATWQTRNKGMGLTRVDDFLSVGGDLYAAAGGWGLYRTSDRGEDWTPSTGLRDDLGPRAKALASSGAVLFAAVESEGVYASADRGKTWSRFGEDQDAYDAYDLEAEGGFVYANNGSLYRSPADHAAWSRCDGGLPGRVHDLLAQGSSLYATTDSGVGLSTDHGNTWTFRRALAPGSNLDRITALGGSLVAIGPEGLYRSTDRGSNWAKVHALPVRNPPVFDMWTALESTSAGIFAGTALGAIHFSADSGATWRSLDEGLGWVPLSVLAFAEHQGEVYVGARGVFKRPLSSLGPIAVRRDKPREAAARNRLASALRILRGLGMDLRGRSTSPGAPRSP